MTSHHSKQRTRERRGRVLDTGSSGSPGGTREVPFSYLSTRSFSYQKMAKVTSHWYPGTERHQPATGQNFYGEANVSRKYYTTGRRRMAFCIRNFQNSYSFPPGPVRRTLVLFSSFQNLKNNRFFWNFFLK